MKNRIARFITLCVTISCIVFQLNAQDAGKQRPKMTAEQRTEKRLEMMKKKLVLSDEQVTKMRSLILAQEKIREQNMKEAVESNQKMIGEMEKILRPEQMARFKEIQEQRKEKVKEQRMKRVEEEK